jgi:hypothetical protein
MASYPRLILQFAAASAIAGMLAAAAPAMAADMPAKPGEPARKVATSTIKRHDWRCVSPGHRLDCSGPWCGRQFVLMVGIAY